MRVATYSRFSSDLQDRRSIADQQRELHGFAEARGWLVVVDFADEVVSGASLHGRPALADCLAQGRAGLYDAILLESLDRLARSVADTATIQRDLSFHGLKLMTIADNGEVPPLMSAIKSAIAEQFLVDLGQKVRRGMAGRVAEGKIAGGLCFGYRAGAQPGERLVDEHEAAIVRRVFEQYAAGQPTKAIVRQLNDEGVRAPRGGHWNVSTLIGNAKRQNGLLNNSLYRGEITFNRQHFVTDPTSGRRQARLNPKSKWQVQKVEALRIVDDAMWRAVQMRRKSSGAAPLRARRGPRRMLSGLLRCGLCGSSYVIVRSDLCGCSGRQNAGICDNARQIRMADVEQRVLAAVKAQLMSPAAVAAAVEAYRAERARLAKLHAQDRRAIETELGVTRRKLQRAMDAMLNADDAVANYTGLISELSRRVQELEAKLPMADTAVLTLHPQAAERYKAKVAAIQEALGRGDGAAHEAIQLVRSLINKIVVIPPADPKGRMGLEVFGDLSALLGNQGQQERYGALDGCGGRI